MLVLLRDARIKTHLESVSKYGERIVAMSPEPLSECRQERCHGEKIIRLCACCHLSHR